MSTDLLGKFLALLCALLWAVAVIFFKKAGTTMRPTTLNLYKTLVAAILLFPVLLIGGIDFFPGGLTFQELVLVLISGILGIALSDTLLFKCLNMLGAGLTAIVESMYAPMVMAFSWLLIDEGLGFQQALGAGLVVLAVLVASLKIEENHIPPRQLLAGLGVGAMAMALMGISIVMMKPALEKTSAIWVTEVRLLTALVVLWGMILFSKNRQREISSLFDRENWRHAFPGTILGNFLAMTIWVAAFKLTDLTSAAILNQTNTIFLVILASIWLKEPFTPRRFFAAILAFAGSILVLNS